MRQTNICASQQRKSRSIFPSRGGTKEKILTSLNMNAHGEVYIAIIKYLNLLQFFFEVKDIHLKPDRKAHNFIFVTK